MKTLRVVYPRSVLVILSGAFILYFIIAFFSQAKLIYTDEIGFAHDMERLARGDWLHAAIPHPPLYVWLGGLFIRAWGDNLLAMRLPGELSFLATLWLLPLACHTFIPNESRATRASLIAVVIYAIHPLALQGSFLLDIDNTLFTPALLLFLIAVARTESAARLTRIVSIGFAFALMLWTKLLPTPLVVVVATLGVYVLRRKFFLNTLLGILFGLFLFIVTFAIFLTVTNFQLSTFAATFQRTQQPLVGGIARLVTRGVEGGGILLVWLGIPFALIYLWVVARRVREVARTRRAISTDILLATTLGGLGLYTLGNELPMGFPRYHYPLFALMVLLVGDYLAGDYLAGFEFASARERAVWLAGIAASALYFAFVIPDPLLPQYDLTFETNDLVQRLAFGARLEIIAFVIPFALLCLAFALMFKLRARAFLFASVAFCLAAWSVLTITQARAEYATIYEYGRVGAAAMSELVAARTNASDEVIAPLEIIFAAHRPGEFVLQYVCPDCQPDALIDKFATQPPAVFVLTPKEDGRYTQVTRDPNVVAWLDRCYTDRATIGSYTAYFRAQSSCQ